MAHVDERNGSGGIQALRRHLSSLFITEVLDDGDFRYRLIGTAVNRAMDRDIEVVFTPLGADGETVDQLLASISFSPETSDAVEALRAEGLLQ